MPGFSDNYTGATGSNGASGGTGGINEIGAGNLVSTRRPWQSVKLRISSGNRARITGGKFSGQRLLKDLSTTKKPPSKF